MQSEFEGKIYRIIALTAEPIHQYQFHMRVTGFVNSPDFSSYPKTKSPTQLV